MSKYQRFTFNGVDFEVEYFEDGVVHVAAQNSFLEFRNDQRIEQIKFVRKMVEQFGNVKPCGLKATKDFVDSYYKALGIPTFRTVTDNKIVHVLSVRESQCWAEVTEESNIFRITDAWNCGMITAEIRFPNLATARFYLAGRWNIPAESIQLIDSKEVKPELTIDEKIVKVVRQFWRGIITEQDLFRQFYVLQDAEEDIAKASFLQEGEV